MSNSMFSDTPITKQMLKDLKIGRDFFAEHFVSHEVVYVYKKNNNLLHLAVNMKKNNFMHLFGVTYIYPNRLYRELSDERINKLNHKLIKEKTDGTTIQKLGVAKDLYKLIGKDVFINDKQQFSTFSPDQFIRSNEKTLALCLIKEPNKEPIKESDKESYVPNSLLDLSKAVVKEKQLRIMYPVVYIRKFNKNTRETTLLYQDESLITEINEYLEVNNLGVFANQVEPSRTEEIITNETDISLRTEIVTSQTEEIITNETDISLRTEIVTSQTEEIIINETDISLRTETVTSQTEEISINKTDTSFEKETDKLIKRIEDTVHYTEQNISSKDIKKDLDMD